MSAEIIVLASPNEQNPFVFEAQSVLQGDINALSSLPPIPFLVDSSVRVAGRTGTPPAVLMTYGVDNFESGFSKSTKRWHRLFRLEKDRYEFVSDVLAKGKDWVIGATASAGKVAFFSSYLDHPDIALRDAALAELDRAPYALLSKVDSFPPKSDLLQNLQSVNRAAFAPISIKLLAVQDSFSIERMLRASYPSKIETNSLRLHAWTIAAIEVDQEKALDRIQNRLSSPQTTSTERLQMISALADVGTARPEMRNAIASVYRTSLNLSLTGVSEIALSMAAWNDSSMTAIFREILNEEILNPATHFALRAAINIDS